MPVEIENESYNSFVRRLQFFVITLNNRGLFRIDPFRKIEMETFLREVILGNFLPSLIEQINFQIWFSTVLIDLLL